MVSVKDSVIYAGPDRRVVTEVPVTESARDASDGGPAYADPNNARVRGLPTVVWRHACSSTPKTWTPSKRVGSAISNWWPVARTASLAVCQDTPSPAAIRAIDIRSMTTLFNAHITACVE